MHGAFNCDEPFECSNTSIITTTGTFGDGYKSIYGDFGNGASINCTGNSIHLQGAYSAQYCSFIISDTDFISCPGSNAVKF